MKPDLIIAWSSGNSTGQFAKLKQLGLPIYQSEPRNFETIATSPERLGRLAGTAARGQMEVRDFRQRWRALAAQYHHRRPVSVFYQIWRAPRMTLNDAHIVSEALHLCGGKNVFGHLPQLAPSVSMESVLEINAQAIVTTSLDKNDPLAAWRRVPQLYAVKNRHLFVLEADHIHRATPRMPQGMQTLCERLDAARTRQ